MSEPLDDSPFHDDGWPSLTSQAFIKNGIDVRTSSCPGYLCKIRAKGLISLPVDEAFAVLTLPDTTPVFRAIDETLTRRVLDTTTALSNEVFVQQAATVGALFFKRRVITSVHVRELPEEHASHFQLARPGIMAAFEGCWILTPVRAADVASVPCPGTPAMHGKTRTEPEEKTIFYLEQDIAPAIAGRVPSMFHGLLRRICSTTATAVVHDLNVIGALRSLGVPMSAILRCNNVHGRQGLAHRILSGDNARTADKYDASSQEGVSSRSERSSNEGFPVNGDKPMKIPEGDDEAGVPPSEWRGDLANDKRRAELEAALRQEISALTQAVSVHKQVFSHAVPMATSDLASSEASSFFMSKDLD